MRYMWAAAIAPVGDQAGGGTVASRVGVGVGAGGVAADGVTIGGDIDAASGLADGGTEVGMAAVEHAASWIAATNVAASLNGLMRMAIPHDSVVAERRG